MKTLLMLPIMIVTLTFCTIVSASELNNIQIIKDFNHMVKSENLKEAEQSDSVWSQLEKLQSYSADTWFFLSRRDVPVAIDNEFLSPRLRPYVPGIKAKFNLSAGRLVKEITSNKVDLPSDPIANGILQKTVNDAYQVLQKSESVYVWERADGNGRIPHYCRNECACVAKELSVAIRNNYADVKVYSLYLQGGSYGFVEVQRATANGSVINTPYTYHVALLAEIDGNYFVIDPIVLGHSRLTDPSEWLSKFTMRTPILLQISKQ